jgi:hypothetical protein
MLDAVKAALDGKAEESPPSEPGKVEASDPKKEAEPTKAKTEETLTSEEQARLSVKAKARYQAIISQRDTAETKLKDLEPKAAQYDVIVKQIRETGLDQTDLNAGFELMTLMKKGDFFGARAKLAPIWDQISKLTGGDVPKDLVEEIAAGKLSEARARELSVARAAAQIGNQRQQAAVQESERARSQQLTTATVDSVNAWEKQKAAIDPDWKLKAPEIMRSLKLSLLEGNRPATVQDAVAMAEKALEEVNTRFKAYRPAPRAIRPVVGNVGASNRSNSDPKNMLDIVRSMTG